MHIYAKFLLSFLQKENLRYAIMIDCISVSNKWTTYMDSSILKLVAEQEIPGKTAGNGGEEEKGITFSLLLTLTFIYTAFLKARSSNLYLFFQPFVKPHSF